MFNKLLKKHAKNEKGLTLIELLVVIVILGIIAAIAVVSIGGIIGKTKDKAAVSEAVQIIKAAKMAHSTENNATTWTSTAEANNPLKEYVSNLKDNAWTVTFDATTKTYKISDHAALDAMKKTNTSQADPITEAQLTTYLGGN
ncbi:type II secretion system protein [Fictibacillus sp. 5RED26]|uniref:Prepilin-type N-terminal cleavage/methylation domain-containing protein n=1 Tax=Fictibacillus phosphorivorans TaxID=1221500 RepID=A0A160IRK4_9BACL|nr:MULTISPECIES: type II secretion system protein [Fictibacillus]ANC78582.1 hypothetical protein ABE65_017985 [Fictibacillus phosphorivorans]MBH0156858.1 type II secretion system protein [Fictibacillus sp. 5RED26]